MSDTRHVKRSCARCVFPPPHPPTGRRVKRFSFVRPSRLAASGPETRVFGASKGGGESGSPCRFRVGMTRVDNAVWEAGGGLEQRERKVEQVRPAHIVLCPPVTSGRCGRGHLQHSQVWAGLDGGCRAEGNREAAVLRGLIRRVAGLRGRGWASAGDRQVCDVEGGFERERTFRIALSGPPASATRAASRHSHSWPSLAAVTTAPHRGRTGEIPPQSLRELRLSGHAPWLASSWEMGVDCRLALLRGFD